MAMSLRSRNPHVHFGEVEARHWRQLGLVAAGDAGWSAMLALVEAVGPALERTERRLPPDFPPQVWDSVSAGMRRHADRFRAGLPHGGDAARKRAPEGAL